jgi:hypothetical protein
MRRRALTGAFVALALASSVVASSPRAQDVPQDPAVAGTVLRTAIGAWAYNQYWRLYAMGSKESRSRISEKDFVEQMQRGSSAPGIGFEILDVRIAGSHALIVAKLQMEYRFSGPNLRNRPPFAPPTDQTIQVMLVYQEGAWRINLHQFVGMASY